MPKNWPEGHLPHNEVGTCLVNLKFTAASNVAGSGYTVNEGSEYVSSVTRADEGKATITLRDAYKKLLAIHGTCTQSTAVFNPNLVNSSITTSTGGTINIGFRSVANAAAYLDPDSNVCHVSIWLKRSGVG